MWNLVPFNNVSMKVKLRNKTFNHFNGFNGSAKGRSGLNRMTIGWTVTHSDKYIY